MDKHKDDIFDEKSHLKDKKYKNKADSPLKFRTFGVKIRRRNEIESICPVSVHLAMAFYG